MNRRCHNHYSPIPNFAVSGNFVGKVPVVDIVLLSHEQEIDPTTSLVVDENFIDFEFQRDCYYYVDLRQAYLALKPKFVYRHVYENYNSTELKKERKKHKEDAKADVETAAASEEDEEPPVPLVTHVNNILHSFVTMLMFTLKINIYTIQMDSMSKSPTIPKNFQLAISEYMGVLHCEGYNFEHFLDKFTESSLPEPFFTKRMKMLSRPGGFSCCWLNWVLTFPPLSNC